MAEGTTTGWGGLPAKEGAKQQEPIKGFWGDIEFAAPVQKNAEFPAWHPPTRGVRTGLVVNNSLCPGQYVEFVPGVGKRVLWYTCGPTVYDSCHMGHARAYLTFDILRRIMEDYFGYEVLYHVNITDIDDKIILRARRNKLLADYEAAQAKDNSTYNAVKDKVVSALDSKAAKLKKKSEELAEPLPGNASAKLHQERETKQQEHKLKEEQFAAVRANVEKVQGNTQALIDAARDELGELLDKELGDKVTDQSVFLAHARKFEKEYLEDMAALGVRDPDVLTRVTEYVDKIIAFVQGIINKGLAYESAGSVYLSIDEYKKAGHDYRKLLPDRGDTSADAMAESEGALGSGGEKRHKNDFALWKASKPGEPFWESPWGQGRPGWHIECSVIASDILGDNMDIHAGGIDLCFPHNDNELAQAEAFYDHQQWVNYFLHAGHLHIHGLKMSKSLKNFITIREALQHHSPRELRLMFLLQAWDKPMNYSDQTMDEAKAKDAAISNFFTSIKAEIRKPWLEQPIGWTEADQPLYRVFAETQTKVHEAFSFNFCTADALTAIFKLITETNKALRSQPGPAPLLLKKIGIYVTKILRILGVVEGQDDIGFPVGGAGGDLESTVQPYLDALVDFRAEVRKAARAAGANEVLAACDRVRDETLVAAGVRLDDQADGSARWGLDDPEKLRAELAKKKEQEEAQRKKKLTSKIEKLKKDLDAARQVSGDPKLFFQTGDKTGYGGFDDDGLPTTQDDKELSEKVRKKLRKQLDTYIKKHQKLVADSDGDFQAYFDRLEQEIADKEAELDPSKTSVANAAAPAQTTTLV